jgi:hypothetical protein
VNRHQVADLATNLLHRVEVLEWKNDAMGHLLADVIRTSAIDHVEQHEILQKLSEILRRQRVVRTRKDGNVVFFPYPKRRSTP